MQKIVFFLSYIVNNQNIKGNLYYKNFEKDSSKGTITGKLNSDTLRLIYDFMSEGIQSQREIYFLQKNGVLLEGIGQQSMNRNVMKYISTKEINFTKGSRLAPIDCNNFKKHFKN